MTRLKQAGVLALGLAVAGVMLALGVWQLNVYGAQGSRVAQDRAALPAVALDQVASPGQPVNDGYGRTVTVTGRYDAGTQVVIPLPDEPGRSRVVLALLLPDGGALPVVRGVIDDGVPIPAPPGGMVRQQGILLASEAPVTDRPGSKSTPTPPGQLTSVQLPVLAQRWSPDLINGYVTLDAADAQAQGLQPAVAVLPQGEGRSRNAAYALQWWIFAAFAVGMAAKMARDIGRVDEYEEALAEEAPEADPTVDDAAVGELADSQADPAHRA